MSFAKTGALLKQLGQLSQAKDMTAATERTGAAKAEFQVQVKDEAGFWCVVANCATNVDAEKHAAVWRQTSHEVRVVGSGPRREGRGE